MIMSITERGRPFEYYPEMHIQTLTDLYGGRFTKFGLTVDGIIGRPKARIFRALQLTQE